MEAKPSCSFKRMVIQGRNERENMGEDVQLIEIIKAKKKSKTTKNGTVICVETVDVEKEHRIQHLDEEFIQCIDLTEIKTEIHESECKKICEEEIIEDKEVEIIEDTEVEIMRVTSSKRKCNISEGGMASSSIVKRRMNSFIGKEGIIKKEANEEEKPFDIQQADAEEEQVNLQNEPDYFKHYMENTGMWQLVPDSFEEMSNLVPRMVPINGWQHVRATPSLYIRFPLSLQPEDLEDHFSKSVFSEEVTNLYFPEVPKAGNPTYCFAEFTSEYSARREMEKLNGKPQRKMKPDIELERLLGVGKESPELLLEEFKGEPIIAVFLHMLWGNFALPVANDYQTLQICRLPYFFHLDDVRRCFPASRDIRRNQRSVFVEFWSRKDAMLALRSCVNLRIRGRSVVVFFASKRERGISITRPQSSRI